MNRKKLRIILLVLGILALFFSLALFASDTGAYESNEYYGGDAYTGIQQAAAQTANNVLDLAYIIRNGLAYILLIHSGVLLGTAVCIEIPAVQECKYISNSSTISVIEHSVSEKEKQEVEK